MSAPNKATAKEITPLYRLAELYGVETSHYDGMGRFQQASTASLLTVLKSLGAPLDGLNEANHAWRECRQKLWQRPCAPVHVIWDHKPASVNVNIPVHRLAALLDCRLVLENGSQQCWTCQPKDLPVVQASTVEGTQFKTLRLDLPAGLPHGYHNLQLFFLSSNPALSTFTSFRCQTLLIAAPSRAYRSKRAWGGFLPLYALQSDHNLGSGDLTGLGELLQRIQGLGGNFIGTLPLLATFMNDPFEPSPYTPASRLFWNEFYLDIARIPEFNDCPAAKKIFYSGEFQKTINELNNLPLIDYRRGMSLKKRILVCLTKHCFKTGSKRKEELLKWANNHPFAFDYAKFRAVQESRRASWPAWPQRMQKGLIQDGDYDPEMKQYHLYVQWVADEQFRSFSGFGDKHGQRKQSGLYLDLPLGVNMASFDVWREKNIFALDINTGAPPDSFFTRGQDWGFPPMHPAKIREYGYGYYKSCLQHHMQYAQILRLDHAASLHRLFWIPKGADPKNGVYVHYHPDEFYALLTLESSRHQTALVGEDLGTVPEYVRTAMNDHHISHMYILPFQKNNESKFNPVEENSLASLNTHDMLPFNAYWAKQDPSDRISLVKFLMQEGWLAYETVDAGLVLEACLKFLAASPARLVLINLEDLWLEMAPQNIPGTQNEHPNWRRKARHTIENLFQIPQYVKTLQEINRLRRRPSKYPLERMNE